jgi:hypothetical protein
MKSLLLDANDLTALSGCTFESLESISFARTSLTAFINNTFPKLTRFSSISTMIGNYLGALPSITFSYGGMQMLIF